MKFEDKSQEETERRERCARARGDAWILAKKILKLKETDTATFFSPTNEWCHPAPSVIKPEEREFVADSGASMHMLNRKDLNSVELEIVRVSIRRRSVKLLKNTPAVLSHSENSAKIPDIPSSGPLARNHNSSKVADE